MAADRDALALQQLAEKRLSDKALRSLGKSQKLLRGEFLAVSPRQHPNSVADDAVTNVLDVPDRSIWEGQPNQRTNRTFLARHHDRESISKGATRPGVRGQADG